MTLDLSEECLQALATSKSLFEFQAYDYQRGWPAKGLKLRGTFQKFLAELQRLIGRCYSIDVSMNFSIGNTYSSADLLRTHELFLSLDGETLEPIQDDIEIPAPRATTETSHQH